MIEIFLKVIATVFVTYGGVWFLFSGYAMKPFQDTDSDPNTVSIKEGFGLFLALVGTLVVIGSLIAIVWLV